LTVAVLPKYREALDYDEFEDLVTHGTVMLHIIGSRLRCVNAAFRQPVNGRHLHGPDGAAEFWIAVGNFRYQDGVPRIEKNGTLYVVGTDAEGRQLLIPDREAQLYVYGAHYNHAITGIGNTEAGSRASMTASARFRKRERISPAFFDGPQPEL
jgi:hypothetical protein